MASNFSATGNYICTDCDKKYEKLQSYNAHRSHHSKNRKIGSGWNKGLTKETDERVNKISKTLKKSFEIGEITHWAKGLTKETDERILLHSKKVSKTVKEKIKKGEWHNSFSKARTHEYKGVRLYGKWELNYAKWLDKNNIKWRRVTETFQYEYQGKIRRYTPDFYLIDSHEYIEIKGYKTKKDEAKWKQFPMKLKILLGEDLFQLGIIKEYRKTK